MNILNEESDKTILINDLNKSYNLTSTTYTYPTLSPKSLNNNQTRDNLPEIKNIYNANYNNKGDIYIDTCECKKPPPNICVCLFITAILGAVSTLSSIFYILLSNKH